MVKRETDMKNTEVCGECGHFKNNVCRIGQDSPVITYDGNGTEYCFDKSPGSAYHAKPMQTGRSFPGKAAQVTEKLTC